MKTVFIVDDDADISSMLRELLTREGYNTVQAYSGSEVLLLLEKDKPDLVLLDLMLPGLSGEDILPKLCGIPVIVVSAKTDVQNKIGLLRGGAVDYITKPFDTGELLARIAVHLRDGQHGGRDVLTCGELRLDISSHSVTVNGAAVSLTKTEFAILKLLMQNNGQVIAKSVILDRIAVDTPDCTERSLKQHISNLRRKLADVDGIDRIEAVWGLGFRLNT